MDKLEVSGLTKEYEGKPLLNGVDFTVSSGETLCLLGSSGSGKSTILRIIAGIEQPDNGTVLWNGGDIQGIPVYKRNFGLMFQDYSLFPHLTVAENIGFGLKMRGLSTFEISQKVQDALIQVNMPGFADRRVTDLSGGEQQRIALARALAPRPRLLMLDEPLAALDRTLRVELQDELRELLHKTNIPAIYVTHDQEEALIVSDHVALLHEGMIVQNGTTEEVYTYPATRWSAEFLGMDNFVTGIVTSVDPLKVETEFGTFFLSLLKKEPVFRKSEEVTLLLKPFGMKISAERNRVNQVNGIVKEVSFRGDHYRIKLLTISGQTFKFVSPKKAVENSNLYLDIPPESVICLVK